MGATNGLRVGPVPRQLMLATLTLTGAALWVSRAEAQTVPPLFLAPTFGVGDGPATVAVGDFDGDGKQDLATADTSSNTVTILLGQGNGNFTGNGSFGVGSGPRALAVGDFDGDGQQDLATVDEYSDTASILLNQSNAWMSLGSGLLGVTGIPYLAGAGTLEVGSAGNVALSNAAPSAAAMIFISLASTPTAFKCGTLVPVPFLANVLLQTDSTGTLAVAWASSPAGLAGQTLYVQCAVQDGAAVCSVALSNALRKNAP